MGQVGVERVLADRDPLARAQRLYPFAICVCWRMLDEPADAPESFRWEVLAVHEAPDRPFGLRFSEV